MATLSAAQTTEGDLGADQERGRPYRNEILRSIPRKGFADPGARICVSRQTQFVGKTPYPYIMWVFDLDEGIANLSEHLLHTHKTFGFEKGQRVIRRAFTNEYTYNGIGQLILNTGKEEVYGGSNVYTNVYKTVFRYKKY